MDMVRHGNENVVIADRLHRWAGKLFEVRFARDLPAVIAAEIQSQFVVPQVAIKIWGVDGGYAGEAFAQGVSGDTKTFASSLTQPYCGVNSGFEAVQWLQQPEMAMSVTLIPLREGPTSGTGPAFGLLVLASPDPQRFNAGMGTDFLERIGEVASAALSRLRKI
jgi:uncharacterized protein